MQNPCGQCSKTFEIVGEDLEFYDKASPVLNNKKYSISPPTLCSDCRQQRRLAIRNERTLYKRKCSLCLKDMISIYFQDTVSPIYCQGCFWSDKWNALEYGQEINFQEPFFQQFQRLMEKVPRLGIVNKQAENSEYCNYSFANKNCYLTFGNHYEEDCLYGCYSTKNKNCVDYLWLYKSELCYECSFSKNCYGSIFLDHCENSQECLFSIDLKACKNCLFSQNLRHKQYYIFNQPYTKEEYFKKLTAYNLNNIEEFTKAKKFFYGDFRKKFPFKALYQTNCENCEGDNHQNSKNLRNCFASTNCQDCAYGYQMDETYNSMDISCSGYDRCELSYETAGCSGIYHCLFCDSCWNNNDLNYCQLCFSAKNCFGCIALNQKEYCILNKQYSKEEYEKLIPRIIEHMGKNKEWGEFFPASISPFGYNETVANEYFSLEVKQVSLSGFKWKIPDKKDYIPQKYQVPNNIFDVSETIVNEILACCDCKKSYRIIKQELVFYRNMKLPIPTKCPDCRHKDRINFSNPRKLWMRNCDKCKAVIQTTFSPKRSEIVYCEKCYLQEVY